MEGGGEDLSFTINNVKSSFRFKPCKVFVNRDPTYSFKQYNNFFVLKGRFVYTVFWKVGYANVTKVSSLRLLRQARKEFLRLAGVTSLGPINIQNIHANGKKLDFFTTPLREVHAKLRASNIPATFNTSFFPGKIRDDNSFPINNPPLQALS